MLQTMAQALQTLQTLQTLQMMAQDQMEMNKINMNELLLVQEGDILQVIAAGEFQHLN